MDMGHPEIAEIYRDLQQTPPLLKLDVYPSQQAPIFTAESVLPTFCKWGFDGIYGKQLIINARAETVTDKPWFATDFKCNRCVVPSSGFYEWDSDKNKHLFERADGKALFLAGFCKMQNERRFVILTKVATPPVAEVHNRMPVLLDKSEIDSFLCDTEFALQRLAETNSVLLTREL